jgi:hypothetical protein
MKGEESGPGRLDSKARLRQQARMENGGMIAALLLAVNTDITVQKKVVIDAVGNLARRATAYHLTCDQAVRNSCWQAGQGQISRRCSKLKMPVEWPSEKSIWMA